VATKARKHEEERKKITTEDAEERRISAFAFLPANEAA